MVEHAHQTWTTEHQAKWDQHQQQYESILHQMIPQGKVTVEQYICCHGA